MTVKPVSIKRLVLCLFAFVSFNVSAQKTKTAHIDSLLSKLPAAREDTNKVNLLISLGTAYSNIAKSDSSLFYLQRSLQLSGKLKWSCGVMMSYYRIGEYYYAKKDYVNAQNYLNRAFELSAATDDDKFTVDMLAYVAGAVYYQHNPPRYNAPVNYLLAALKRFQKSSKTTIVQEIYVLLGDYNQTRLNYGDAKKYYEMALATKNVTGQKYLRSNDVTMIARFYENMHEYPAAKKVLLKAQANYVKAGDIAEMADNYGSLGDYAGELKDYDGSIAYYNKLIPLAKKIKDGELLCIAHIAISYSYIQKKDYNNAYSQIKLAQNYANNNHYKLMSISGTLGSIYRLAPDSVLRKAGIDPADRYKAAIPLLTSYLKYRQSYNDVEMTIEALKELSATYAQMHNYENAFKIYKAYVTKRDSADSLKDEKDILLKQAQTNYLRQEDSLKYQQRITGAQLKEKKVQSYFFIGGIVALLILSVFIWLNFNNQRKSNKLLNEQREEITMQRDQLAITITELKAAQQQLIQSEKMASLGELTAGIAHEIQNPLNFVNNFSEVSMELLEELKQEAKSGNTEEAIAIADDLTNNLGKINHHGKRADSIVKGMLEHSRASTGQKEPTDLNKLADEYLRLAYHGLRAKDKSFNAELVTHFDEKLPLANVIPQDMGRVLLNLFNNAFYAVNEKRKTENADYKPTVELTTFAPPSGGWGVKVRDNGNGIPDAIQDKIMQPFFTTKPTGEGTGLGLSLSYDIIVKGHGGSVNVETKEGEGSVFTIQIPTDKTI